MWKQTLVGIRLTLLISTAQRSRRALFRTGFEPADFLMIQLYTYIAFTVKWRLMSRFKSFRRNHTFSTYYRSGAVKMIGVLPVGIWRYSDIVLDITYTIVHKHIFSLTFLLLLTSPNDYNFKSARTTRKIVHYYLFNSRQYNHRTDRVRPMNGCSAFCLAALPMKFSDSALCGKNISERWSYEYCSVFLWKKCNCNTWSIISLQIFHIWIFE